MITKMYTIHDIKAETFMVPFFQQNDETAKRLMTHSANNPEHFVGKNPADYTLFYIGEYEDNSGAITPALKIKNLGNGLEFVISRPVLMDKFDGAN